MSEQAPTRPGRRLAVGPALPLVPFFAFAFVFLIVPTVTVLIGAFRSDTGLTTANLQALTSDAAVRALKNSVILSAVSATVGAIVGGMLAYIVARADPRSVLRRAVVAVSGVLAQFGGVTLAFAFIAAYSYLGIVTVALRAWPGLDLFGDGWLYRLPGLVLVYCYFQIPLMVIVFLPAVEGLRPQWREAAVNLGATGRQYWFEVAIPLLRPAFLGSLLLLFANAFAAYATAAALVSQGAPITPLLIRAAFVSEVILGQKNVGFALALEMIVVVALVMGAYALLLKRTSRWLQ
jgi:putative spermidine/putrescine transport system permease protein